MPAHFILKLFGLFAIMFLVNSVKPHGDAHGSEGELAGLPDNGPSGAFGIHHNRFSGTTGA